MRSDDETLIEACRLARDDDAPRLVWADRVGGERGELVVLQCDLARGGLAPAEVAMRRRRERELLAQHGDAWAGLDRYTHRYEFRRGFVEAALVHARLFLDHEDAIFEAAPMLGSLSAAGLTGAFDDGDGVVRGPDTLALLARLVASSGFWRLDALEICGAGVQEQDGDYNRGFTGLGDEAAEMLAASGALAHLRALGITSSRFGAPGVHALIASRELDQLETLWLHEHELGTDAAFALVRATPRVTSLVLEGPCKVEVVAPALGAIRELAIAIAGTDAERALMTSRAARTIESLALSGELALGDAFAAFPRLHTLDLRRAVWRDSARAVAAFVRTPLPALRHLVCHEHATTDELRAIAATFGPQLEVLEAHRAPGDPLEVELQPQVAGEVVCRRDLASRML